MSDQPRENPPETVSRQDGEYEAPRLVVYGSIAEITRAIGAKSSNDGGTVTGHKKSQP